MAPERHSRISASPLFFGIPSPALVGHEANSLFCPNRLAGFPIRFNKQDTIPASLYGETGGRFSTSSSFRVDPRSGQPRAGFPWRSAFAAFVLFAFGITFLLLGTLHFRDKDHGTFVAFTTIGALTFLPGAYASYNLYHAIRGTPGWHLSDFAHFDDYRW